VAMFTRCIRKNLPETIGTTEDEQYWDLTSEITNFYDIDEYPGGGVYYNNKALKKTTIAELNMRSSTWLDRGSGTPKKYFRRSAYLWVDRPIDSNEYDIKVYAVLKPNDFDSDADEPYNELSYLEPFHYGGIGRYLMWQAKLKLRKFEEAAIAQKEFLSYCGRMKKQLSGGLYGPISIRNRSTL